MNLSLEWSLKELYPSFQSEEFKKDYEDAKNYIEEMKAWAENNFNNRSKPVEKIENFIHMQNDFSRYYNLLEYARLIISVDTVNGEAAKWLDLLEEMFSELTSPVVLFQNFLREMPNLDVLMNSSRLLQEHSFVLKEMQGKAEYLLSREEEVLLAKLQTTGSQAWEKMKEQLTGTLMVEMGEGEEKYPLTVIRNNAYEEDGELRKKSYEAELEAYKKIDKAAAFALNSIKGEVLSTCRLKGYQSPLEMTLLNARLDRDILEALLSAIRDSLPMFRRYFRKKAQMLGHEGGLPFYDLFAPLGRSDKKYSYDEASDFVIRHFTSFNPRLGQLAQRAIEGSWVDVSPREGKRGGAFCSNIHPIGQSRIMLNFTGSFNDVLTLAHELGHGYHGDCLVRETYLNSNYSMPIAETASTLCETIVAQGALKSAEPEEALNILENDISGAAQVIVDIYSRFLFEDRLFQNRKEGVLSVCELKELMLEAQKEAYGDGLDFNYLHPYMWICKPHYYDASYNYYNFPYAYGLLFAKGLYGIYEMEGQAFTDRLDRMLAATGKNNLRDAAKLCGIDVGEPSFWKESLKVIERDIDKFTNM